MTQQAIETKERTPFYEGFLRRHFPAWGARREKARLDGADRRMQATYREGVSSRLRETWSARTPLSMQSESTRYSIRSLRRRSEEAYQNNPVARGIMNAEVDNVVSHGMTVQAQSDSEDFNDEAEEKWAAWIDRAELRGMLDATQLQRQTWISGRVSGDCGLVLVSAGTFGESKLQLVTAERISTPDDKITASNIYDGVEVDAAGKPIAFHVLDQNEAGRRKWARINADDFAYFCYGLEAYDLRGTPCFTTILDMLNNLDQYVDGVALAAWMATVFGIIEKRENAGKTLAQLPTQTNSSGDQQKGITYEGGMMKYIGPADSVLQIDAKQPMQQTPDFIRMMLRLIGVPFDMPLELVLRDVSQSNLSSLRGGIQAFRRACKAKQEVYGGVNQWGKVYRWWISREKKMGKFVSKAPENFAKHEFMFHGWQFTDPEKDIAAAQLEVDGGFNSWDNILYELGRDPDRIDAQNAKRRASRKVLGIPDVASGSTRDRVEPKTESQSPKGKPQQPNDGKGNAAEDGVGEQAGKSGS